eukprot:g9112.t1
MPTSRRAGAHLTISPWKTVRRGNNRQQQLGNIGGRKEVQDSSIREGITLKEEQCEEYQRGLTELIKNEQSIIQRFGSELDQKVSSTNTGIGILVFDHPSGIFFSVLLDRSHQRVRFYTAGEAIETSVQNCGHDALGCQFYKVYISESKISGKEECLTTYAMNTGGDSAKLISASGEEVNEEARIRIFFQCLQLYIDATNSFWCSNYFSKCGSTEDVVINVGIMEIHMQ